MNKTFLIIFSILFSVISNANTNEYPLERTYHCLKNENSTFEIAFDRYNSRISHKPFKKYNKLKEEKTVIYDDVAKALETTYTEYKGRKKTATLIFISKGNEFWRATYIPIGQEAKDLDETRFDLNKLQATCF